MIWLNYIPLLRLILPFSSGIIWAFYFPQKTNLWVIVLLFLTVLSLLALIEFKQLHANIFNRWVFGLFAFILLFFLGNSFANSTNERFNPNHFSHFLHNGNKVGAYIGTISSELELKPNSVKAILEIKSLKIDSNWVSCTGKCLIYFKKDPDLKLQYGDEIVFTRQPSEINSPTNFDAFNYKKYLSHHYIYAQVYLTISDYKRIGQNPPNILKKTAIKWRNRLLSNYEKFGISGAELAILSALTLGKKESLTPDLKTSYSSAGAMHVLAVSGLHVGIIFLVMKFLLSWLDKYKIGSIIKAILLLVSVWIYAIITGFSPSVIRAATMFSFMILAITIQKNSNIYNTLGLSAFAILLVKPFMLLEVGFQLSYLAVIGIIYIHPFLYNLFNFKYWIVNQAWNITCVSIAAQLTTAPLGILYFHQFPTYFLISNLLIIPAAFLIMGISILFQSLYFIPYMGEVISWVLKNIVWVLNSFVIKIEHLPISLIKGLDISTFETWILYVIIASILIWLTTSTRVFSRISLFGILLLSCTQTIEKWNQLNQKEITFYTIGNHFAVEFKNGNQSFFWADSNLLSNKEKMQFHVYHHWWKRGISSGLNINQKAQPLILGNTKILPFDPKRNYTAKQIHLFQPDILYFNTFKNPDLESMKGIENQPIIISGKKNSKLVTNHLEEFCKTHHWQFYNMKSEGGIKIKLNEDYKPEKIYTVKTSLKE